MDVLPYRENLGAHYVMELMPNQFQHALHVSTAPFLWYQVPNYSPMASMHETDNFGKVYYGYSICSNPLTHLGISAIRKILHNALFSLQEYGNRVSFQMTSNELRVTPLEILRPPNTGTNISLPYKMIDLIYVDPFIPELLNIIFTDTSGIRHILVYMLNSIDVHSLKTALNVLMGKRHPYFDASLAYRKEWPLDGITGIRVIRKHKGNLTKKEKTFLTVPRSSRINNKKLVNNRSSSLVTSRTTHNRKMSSDYAKEKHIRKNRSMSFSPSRWSDYHRTKTKDIDVINSSASESDETLKEMADKPQRRYENGLNTSVRPFMAPQMPMLLRPPGVYNRYVPKASGMMQVPMQNFPRPMEPVTINNQMRAFPMEKTRNYEVEKAAPADTTSGRSSRSSDSAFANMPTSTDWNSLKATSGGRRIVKQVIEPETKKKTSMQNDSRIQDKVLREILDEVKTVKKQVRALKNEKGRLQSQHFSASDDETTIAKSVSHSGKMYETHKKTANKRRKSKS